MQEAFFISIPHSGEQVPYEANWLKSLSEPTLMRDVDRYVDKLYGSVIENLELKSIITSWHRYVVDLNRKEDEFDQTAVVGAENKEGSHPKGLHWCITTHGEILIPEPMTMELHNKLVESYYKPFHAEVKVLRESLKSKYGVVYQLDAHSMPSKGTALHSDPGEDRAEIVISDYHGTSCSEDYKNLVIESYKKAGFEVAYNWPYVGGGITQMYGAPKDGFHTIQVELNRRLYMNEETKKHIPEHKGVQKKIQVAATGIYNGLKDL